jgi:hypothetical protein
MHHSDMIATAFDPPGSSCRNESYRVGTRCAGSPARRLPVPGLFRITALRVVFVGVIAGLFAQPMAIAFADDADNVALHKSYVLSPAPNYPGATSPTGAVELTDGVVTHGRSMWTDRRAVGWTWARPVTITIDLGEIAPIGLVTWHTAAGAADVDWPSAIYVFGSIDGVKFAPLGDLVALDSAKHGQPPRGAYAEHTFEGDLHSAAIRYLRFVADPHGPYLFVDEIQAFRGAAPPSEAPLQESVDTTAFFSARHAGENAAGTIRNDLVLVQTRLSEMNLTAEQRSAFDLQAVENATAGIDAMHAAAPRSAAFPIDANHARLFATLGAAEQAAGAKPLSAWAVNPWAPTSPEDLPRAVDPPRVEILAMRGESRAGAFNIHNATAMDVRLTLFASVDGIAARGIELAPVAFTGTSKGRWLGAKIQPSMDAVTVPAGTTQQIWVTLSAGDAAPGRHIGSIRIEAATGTVLTVPMVVTTFATRFPSRQSLLVYGWDYLQDPGFGGTTAANIDALAQYLRSRGVNAPWAVRGVFDFGRYDHAGHLATQPSTTPLEHWLGRWPSAARYRVFLSATNNLDGIDIGDPRFAIAIADWARYWAAALAKNGARADEVDLLIADEPHTTAQSNIIIAWSNAIRASGVPFRIFEDPTWPQPSDVPPSLLAAVDVVCVNLHLADKYGENYWRWAATLPRNGRVLEVYGTDGPAKMLDPYLYYRSAAWRAHAVGATGIGFWSFSDNGGSESSNDFANRAIDYVPFFLDADRVMSGKHMEALAEGIRDFEYLQMLSSVATQSPTAALRTRAAELMHRAEDGVLASAVPMYEAWTYDRDRSTADFWRFQIGTFLDKAN